MLTVSLFWSFSFRRGFVVHRLWLFSFSFFLFPLFCFGSSFHWKSKSRRLNKFFPPQPSTRCPLEVIQWFNEIHVLLFLCYLSKLKYYFSLSREISSGEILARCFQPVCYARLFSPFNSTPKTQKRVQLKFFCWLLSIENSPVRYFIAARWKDKKENFLLAPISKLTSGRGQLDNSPNRDSVESNRLGQWRSRLANCNCISDAGRCSKRRVDWLFIWALHGSNWFRMIFEVAVSNQLTPDAFDIDKNAESISISWKSREFHAHTCAPPSSAENQFSLPNQRI